METGEILKGIPWIGQDSASLTATSTGRIELGVKNGIPPSAFPLVIVKSWGDEGHLHGLVG